MATPDESVRTNPVLAVLDILGLPDPGEIIPTPFDVAEMIGAPTAGGTNKEHTRRINHG